MDNGSKSLVKLNVGGTWYTTTRSTLESKPNSIFPKMLSEQVAVTRNSSKDGSGYYFIDRDGELFRYILNYLRTAQLNLPSDFKQHPQLISEAKFYGLSFLEDRIRKHCNESASKTYAVEIVEIAHPEKIGVCSARVVLTEDLQEMAPFCDVLTAGNEYESYQGIRGRTWVRSNISRLEWGEVLRHHGWKFNGMTSYMRRIPDITGHGTDLCHMVEKWTLDS